MRMPGTEVLKTIAVMVELYGKNTSQDAAKTLAADLAQFEDNKILEALKKCRFELARFPTLSDIVQRIDDGRPMPDEAWAMIPRDESSSVVWSDEMCSAWGVAHRLIGENEYAARQAFIEKYKVLVSENRSKGIAPRWTPSLGYDKSGRVAALNEAVKKNRIKVEQAQTTMGELEYENGNLTQITDESEKPKYGPEERKKLQERISMIQGMSKIKLFEDLDGNV